MIPRSNSNIFHQEQKIVQHSAPVAIPDWSKIYGSPKTPPGSSKIDSWRQHDGGWDHSNNDDDEDEEEDGGKRSKQVCVGCEREEY
ncbi:hypothetical protein Leryth_013588 [Lithospermum erythrorhizon]|nr:hypothetical protein Leryth_013588 [Lithospermum erythrorhizon]